ncbi:MAG: hypothetical protein H6711_16180 [Myxococcales bacterium]|nr:hypothetical protein [Myxococcales bacterium]
MRWLVVLAALALSSLGAGDIPPGRCSVAASTTGPLAAAAARADAVIEAVSNNMSEGTSSSGASR